MRIIDKIFGDKKGNTVIYLLLTVGVLLLVGSSGFKTDAPAQPQETLTLSSKAAELERVLSHIKGVGETEVMISFAEEGAKEKSLFEESSENSSNQGAVKGVVVVAQGGADTKVREKIIRATKAALGVETHKIEVFERKE